MTAKFCQKISRGVAYCKMFFLSPKKLYLSLNSILMKKLYTLGLIVFSILSIRSFAQDLQPIHATFDYSGPANSTLLGEFDVQNVSSQTLNVVVEMYNKNLQPGHFTYFCWDACYDTTVSFSLDTLVLAPSSITSGFHSYVVSNSAGHDDVHYRFFDITGNSDTLDVLMNFDFMPTGIVEMTTKGSFNFSGPNPANNYSSIAYFLKGKADAKLIVSNMLGSKVNEIKLNDRENSITLSVKDLVNGVYVYSLVVDGKVVTSKRLVVSH
jgi:hypothetical protein